MESLPINVLDAVLLGGLLLGALIGLAKGFLGSGLWMLSWIGAGTSTAYLMPFVKPYARDYIETVWIADFVAGGLSFVGALITFTVVSSFIGNWVRASSLNSLDRTLGMVLGIGTAAVLMCGAYLGIERFFEPSEQPQWANEAKGMPLLRKGAALLTGVVPKEEVEQADKAIRDAQKKAEEANKAQKILRNLLTPQAKSPTSSDSGNTGYSQKQRNDMERLLQGNQ